jgi:hypothetical protein
LLSLHSAAAGTRRILHCPVIGVMLFCRLLFLRNKHVTIWLCCIKFVVWMQQHCPSKFLMGFYLGWGRCYSFEDLAYGKNSELQMLCWNTNKFEGSLF